MFGASIPGMTELRLFARHEVFGPHLVFDNYRFGLSGRLRMGCCFRLLRELESRVRGRQTLH
jgi:hypothetical protein